jgi:hypothetical protein
VFQYSCCNECLKFVANGPSKPEKNQAPSGVLNGRRNGPLRLCPRKWGNSIDRFLFEAVKDNNHPTVSAVILRAVSQTHRCRSARFADKDAPACVRGNGREPTFSCVFVPACQRLRVTPYSSPFRARASFARARSSTRRTNCGLRRKRDPISA